MDYYQRGILTTKLGKVEYTLTDGRHVHLGSSPRNVEADTRALVLRGVPYHVSHHLFLQDDGTWALRLQDRIYVSRFDHKEPSLPARRDLAKALEAAWGEFAKDLGPSLVAAEKGAVEAKVEALRKDIEELQQQITDKQTEIESLEAGLDHIRTTGTLPPER